MPIYVHRCPICGVEREDFMSIAAPPQHCAGCGVDMEKAPQPAGMAFRSPNTGAWFGHRSQHQAWNGGGRPKPKTIGKGHGVGGHRKNPTIDRTQLIQKPRSMP